MRIKSAQISSYKCFRDTPEIRFGSGLNVIIGKNNAGKSALLESLDLPNLRAIPHRSQETVPRPGDPPALANTAHDFRLEFERGEANEMLRPRGELRFGSATDDKHTALRTILGMLLGESVLRVRLLNGAIQEAAFEGEASHDERQRYTHTLVRLPADAGFDITRITSSAVSVTEACGGALWELCKKRVYRFSAERFAVHRSRILAGGELAADASNLPGILAYFAQTKRTRYERLVDLVRSIFPEIREIISENISESDAAIFVYSLTDNLDRTDLRDGLSDCGTGIGQVLAMLYVVVSSTEPRVILIDEPQSFLHPGAVRKLLEIFALYPQHQYIITTHSPVVIADERESSLLLVRRVGFHSEVEHLSPNATRDLHQALAELGARLSDVFGMDAVLWVEGPTEETCLPLILRHFRKESLRNTRILGLMHTGDLLGHSRKLLAHVYERLSNAGVIMPTIVGFLLDREELRGEQREAVSRDLGGRLAFLTRRMLENYLINTEATTSLLNELLDESNSNEDRVLKEQVEGSIREASRDGRFGAVSTEPDPVADPTWLRDVHAARLLEWLFMKLSNRTVEYRKRDHGPRLVEKILHEHPEQLAELADYVDEVISAQSTETGAPAV